MSAEIEKLDVIEATQRYLRFFRKDEPIVRPVELKTSIQKVMSKNVGFVKDQKKMDQALSHLRGLREEMLPQMGITGGRQANLEWQLAIETEFMLDVAEMVTVSAIERKESRGHHQRTDYPQQDDTNWLAHTIIKKSNGIIKVGSEPVNKL